MPRQPDIGPPGWPTCDEVSARLEAFLDEDLDATEAAAIEAHLESCPICSAEQSLGEAVASGLRALPEFDAPPAVLSQVLSEAGADRFQKARTTPRRRPRRRFQAVAALAAALVVAVFGAAFFLRSSTEVAVPTASEPAADPATIARATEEARFALAQLARVSRSTGLKLRDDLLIDRVARPTARDLSRSLGPLFPSQPSPEIEDDPAVIDSDRS